MSSIIALSAAVSRGVWLDRGELDKIIDKTLADDVGGAPRGSRPVSRQPQPGGYSQQPRSNERYYHRKKKWWHDICSTLTELLGWQDPQGLPLEFQQYHRLLDTPSSLGRLRIEYPGTVYQLTSRGDRQKRSLMTIRIGPLS